MNSETRVTLVNTHVHPYESNDLEKEWSELKDDFVGHRADPYDMHKRLDSDIGLVSVLTNHHLPGDSFQRLYEEAEDREDISVTEDTDSHFSYEIGSNNSESRGGIIRGSELSTDMGRHSHFGAAFIPPSLDDKIRDRMQKDRSEPERYLSEDSLHELAEDIPLTWVAHPFAPKNTTPEDKVRHYLEAGDEKDFEAHLGLAKGYSPMINRSSAGNPMWAAALPNTEGGKIYDLAGEYDCGLIPEIDWHAPTPQRAQGLGIQEGESILSELESGNKPIDELTDLDVVGKKWYERPFTGEGLTFPDQVRNTPGVLGVFSEKAREIGLEIWDNEENYERLMKDALSTYEDISADELLEKAYNPKNVR